MIVPADVARKAVNFNRNVVLGNLHPDAESPDDQKADFGEQCDCRAEQRPDPVDLVVDQIVLVSRPESRRFPVSWAKALTTRMRNGVGRTLVTSAQIRSTRSKPVRSFRARCGSRNAMIGSGKKCDQRQPMIDRDQDAGRHGDHQHVGGKIEKMQ